MRIRQIKPEFWKHDGLGEVSRDARLLFIGLWSMADCDGRLDDRPKKIKAEVFPYDNLSLEDVNCFLNELSSHPEKFITRYSVNGEGLIQINAFSKHQKLMGNEFKQSQNGGGGRPNPHGDAVTFSSKSVTTSTQPVTFSTTDIRSNGVTEDRIPPTPQGGGERFEEFWLAYPRKTNKKAGLKAWTKLNPSPELVKTILSAVGEQRKSDQWMRDGGAFIPHAASWLNGERWNDEIKPHLATVQTPHPYDTPEFQRQETYAEKIARINAEDEAWLASQGDTTQ